MKFIKSLTIVLLSFFLVIPAVADEPVKVGFVYVGPVGDHGWPQLAAHFIICGIKVFPFLQAHIDEKARNGKARESGLCEKQFFADSSQRIAICKKWDQVVVGVV